MKLQRFLASDMRQALARIRNELGPDAVILATQRVQRGVEVTAAIDFDVTSQPPAPSAVPPPPAAAAAPEPEEALAGWAATAAASDLGTEVHLLRRLLETQLAALAWNDFTRREPHRARVLEELTRIGVARDVALEVVQQLPPGDPAGQSGSLPLALLARGINAEAGDAALPRGVLALVGPNGAGKTTTLAKLAARWVLEHGPHDLLLVTTDGDRLGSHEQLAALGRLLGVAARTVAGTEPLQGLLRQRAGRGLVLIDTPGLAPRSRRIGSELAPLLVPCEGIRSALVLPASAQAETLDEVVRNYRPLEPACCILTRIDEAATLGPALSLLYRSRLPVAWFCNGPRIPDDIERARPHQLVARAVKLASRSAAQPDAEDLARRFGGSVHVA